MEHVILVYKYNAALNNHLKTKWINSPCSIYWRLVLGQIFINDTNRMKNKKYYTVGTVPKYTRKITERNTIDSLTQYMTAHFPGIVEVL